MLYSDAAEKTRTIYTLVKNGQYSDAVQLLKQQLNVDHKSRAALSLLAYCYVQLHNFTGAAQCYAQLVISHPHVERYRLYLALCYYQLRMFDEAVKACTNVTFSELSNAVHKLMAALKYDTNDLPSAKLFLDKCSSDDKDKEVNSGCIRFKEENFETALQHFLRATKTEGPSLDLLYNVAVGYYKLKQYPLAMRYVEEINQRSSTEHPELDKRSSWMSDHFVSIEAYNLKIAIALKLNDYLNAAQAMVDMPRRDETELDPITLHNQAIVGMEETLGNLLLICCKYGLHNIAVNIMAENPDLVPTYLTQYEYDFIATVVMESQSPEESLSKLETMVQQQGDILQRLEKQTNAVQPPKDEDMKRSMAEAYNETLELYLQVLMEQAKIYWDQRNYKEVEKIFQKSVDFCGKHDLWKLNVGHTLFMQQGKFKEAAGFYEPLVRKNFEKILDSSAIVLANLCVCYILMNQNEAAEELMRKVEKEEDKLLLADPDRRTFHLCIINLVIGTLYCSKGNYEFGISRIIKAMQPYRKKLCAQTWHYVKRCFLSMIENLVKHVIILKDSVLKDCIAFLEACSEFGKLESSSLGNPFEEAEITDGKATVAYESRQLIALMNRIIEL
uniref:Tetratricopeptide repeat protein 30 n=1 Tax=Trichuris muris TaxID=70415 RepID=A0A5S6QJ36_TRIMR